MFKVNIVLKGRVQGVGFRFFTKECADSMNISGKVWNNYDGSVEVIAYIKRKKEIDAFIEKIKVGPEMSSVKEYSVTITPSDPLVDEIFEIVN